MRETQRQSPSVKATQMAVCYVAVGSNMDPERNIPAALEELARLVRVAGISTFYRTHALGPPDQPDYLNGVVRIETDLPPRDIKLGVLRAIEQKLGRVRTGDKYAARTIDLDLILYGDLVLSSADLTLPDPQIPRRAFVGVPLAELEPEGTLPGTGRRFAELFSTEGKEALIPQEAFTSTLRRRVLSLHGNTRKDGC